MKKLKILWMYKYAIDYDFDNHFHMLLARYIKDKDDTFDLVAYGQDLNVGYPDIAPIKYNSSITMQELYNKFKFDVVICNTKSRMFENYRPSKYPYTEEMRVNQWLPSDFASFNVPKIMIDEDSHYEDSDSWYVETGFNLLLQRHYSNYLKFKELGGVKTLWHPFSVDINTFKPDNRIRKNKVVFAGNSTHEIYVHRIGSKQKLNNVNLIDSFEANKKGNDYIEILKDYAIGLSGSSIYNITPAKMFEIMASGTILLTNESDKYGLDILFPKDTYVAYKEDYSDVVNKAKKMLDNYSQMVYTSIMARKHIEQFHSHEQRLIELRQIINLEFNI